MSDKLGPFTTAEVVKGIERLGFTEKKNKNAHRVFQKPGHRYLVTVPNHAGKKIASGTLGNILRATGVTREQFIAAIKGK